MKKIHPFTGYRLIFLVTILLSLIFSLGIEASSHREAPLISNDPLADNTDLYMFRSPDDPGKLTIIANFVPLQLPHGGPNYFCFGENIRYEIHIDNDISTKGDDIVYRVTFTKVNEDPTTFFNIRLGKQNLKATYKLEKSTDGGKSFMTIVANGFVPPNNIGERSIEGDAGLATTYDDLINQAITTASTGEKVYIGPSDDPFFVDLGGIFDVGDAPRQNTAPRDGISHFNISAIVIQVDIADLQKDGKDYTMASNILDPDFVIGAWASASRQMIRTLNGDGTQDFSGDWVQVSRIGMPLTNEAVIPIGSKDRWNALTPYNEDPAFFESFYNPELALYMDDDLFGGAVPAFSPLRVQRNSLQMFDFGNGNDGLFPLKGDPALDGTALDDAIFGTLLLPGSGKPRSVDIWPIFNTGVPNLPPYQLATGKGGNVLAPGKPFINNFLPTGGDMLRINMAVPVTPRDDPAFSSIGLLQAAVLGLTDPAYNTTTDIQFIPNMDGFPNGRRLEDDVVRIELQAVGGLVLAALGLWYDDFTVGDANPVTQDLLNVLGYTTKVEENDIAFKSVFPYVQVPWSGKGVGTGKQIVFEQPEALPPTPFENSVVSFTLRNAENGTDIMPLVDGTQLDLSMLPDLSVRANTNPPVVGSVIFIFDGKKVRKDNFAPYDIGQNQFDGRIFADFEGEHTLTAVPFTKKNGRGEQGPSLSVTFLVVKSEVNIIESFTLRNAENGTDIKQLIDGDVLDLATLPDLNVRANTDPTRVGSVVFELDGKKVRKENGFPYDIQGNDFSRNFRPFMPSEGMHTIKATPFTRRNGQGEAGVSLTVSFEVINGTQNNITAENNIQVESNINFSKGLLGGTGIYPNPVENSFDINFAGKNNEVIAIFIYNLNGKLLGALKAKTDSEFSKVNVNIGDLNLKPGPYLVKIAPGSSTPEVFKIMKK